MAKFTNIPENMPVDILRWFIMMSNLNAMNFNDLPVEVVANIMRYLDYESLLKAAKTCVLWARVICGDPVLKKRLLKQIKKEELQRRRNFFNPTVVSRKESGIIYSSNARKTVRLEKNAMMSEFSLNVKKSEARPFKLMEVRQKKRKMKNQGEYRDKAYKIMRY